MKIRKGFVSNSSSASFVVEVEGKHEDIFNALYENVPAFGSEGCQELAEYQLKMLKEFRTPKEDASENSKRTFKYEVEELEKTIKELVEYEEPDWYKFKGTDIKKEEFIRFKHQRHKDKTVRAALNALHWNVNEIDDGFISFCSGGCICYNGWENIRMHKELTEILSFFMFMKYKVRTRIESHMGSF